MREPAPIHDSGNDSQIAVAADAEHDRRCSEFRQSAMNWLLMTATALLAIIAAIIITTI